MANRTDTFWVDETGETWSYSAAAKDTAATMFRGKQDEHRCGLFELACTNVDHSMINMGGTDEALPGFIRVVVVDGRPITRSGLARLADSQNDMVAVGESGSGALALALIEKVQPDVVSLGLWLNEMTGLQMAREIRDRHPEMGIVVVTGQCDDAVMFQALDNGVSAFVSAEASLAEILGAIRHAAVSPHNFSASGLGQAMRRRNQAPVRLLLSKRENDVLQLLHEGRSVPEVAATLYVSVSTAKTYVARLYEKLEATNRSQALMSAVRRGLIDVSTVRAS